MRYLQKAKVMCTESQTQACGNLEIVTQRETQYLRDDVANTDNLQITDQQTYRGLIDGIGSLTKSLLGTMDAKDEKLIKK